MHYLHTLNPPVLHRNLKTQNLLIDEGGRVKICNPNLNLDPNPHPNPHPHPHPHAHANPNPSPNPHPRRVKICDFGWSRFKTIDSGKTFFHGWQVRGVARSK
jgi:serine/threonine protein kinase